MRRPVWLGLAELFLDTDTRPGLPALALTLAQSGLPETELKGIWEHEVTPLLHANLHSVAGEWARLGRGLVAGAVAGAGNAQGGLAPAATPALTGCGWTVSTLISRVPWA